MKYEIGKKIVAIALTFCFLSMQSALVPTLKAEMISTGSAITIEQLQYDRAQIKDFVNRAEAKNIFEKLGVNMTDIDSRIDQMTTEELAHFNQEAEKLPAAGFSVVGAVILVAVVLFVTDLLGLTDVYSFVN